MTVVVLATTSFPARLQAGPVAQQVVVMVVGYDQQVCNEYRTNCRDSRLSQGFEATASSLERSLAALQILRIDVKELRLGWHDRTKRTRETRSQALVRTLSEAGAAIARDNRRVSALVFVGHGVPGGYIGPTLDGELLSLMELARKVRLADRGAVIAVACSVAANMDLSSSRARDYRLFATSENIDWLDNGNVKLASQPKSMFRAAPSFSLPQQTMHRDPYHIERPTTDFSSPTIQEVLFQTLRSGGR